MQTYVLDIELTARGKPTLTKADRWKKRKPVIDWYAYKDELLLQVGREWYARLNHAVIFDFKIEAFFHVPKSYTKKQKAELPGTRHRVKPDASNIQKGIEDILIVADQCLADTHTSKRWIGPDEPDRIRITIQYVEPDDAEDLEEMRMRVEHDLMEGHRD